MDSKRFMGTARFLMVGVAGYLTLACVRPTPPVEPDAPDPPPQAAVRPTPAPSPPRPAPPPLQPPPPSFGGEDDLASRTLEDLNRESPLEPIFFLYDSAEMDVVGRGVLDANAEMLQRYPSWVITIEGHCDERGTPEYNLGLGERRALAARQYLVTLGLEADRIRTVSYGKEFPFVPGGNEDAWSRNRRAHFVITER